MTEWSWARRVARPRPRSHGPVSPRAPSCWRVIDGKAKVLLVHRTQHKDVSLPKGKVDPGETLPQTAVREIDEETGLSVALGAPLGIVEYLLPSGRDKIVHYWSAEVNDHLLELAKFAPNDEIAALEWLPIREARKKLSYEHDREVVDRLARADQGEDRAHVRDHRAAARQGGAARHLGWPGLEPPAHAPRHRPGRPDRERARGVRARAGSSRSTAARCLATVAPLSQRHRPADQAGCGHQPGCLRGRPATTSPRSCASASSAMSRVVLCSHGPVIPDIIAEVAMQLEAQPDSALRRAGSLGTGDFAVLHVSHRKGRTPSLWPSRSTRLLPSSWSARNSRPVHLPFTSGDERG